MLEIVPATTAEHVDAVRKLWNSYRHIDGYPGSTEGAICIEYGL